MQHDGYVRGNNISCSKLGARPLRLLATLAALAVLGHAAHARAAEPYGSEPDSSAKPAAAPSGMTSSAPSAAPSPTDAAAKPAADSGNGATVATGKTAPNKAGAATAAGPTAHSAASDAGDESTAPAEQAPSGPTPIVWLGGTCLGLTVAAAGAATGLLLSADASDDAATHRGAIAMYIVSGAALVAGLTLVIVGATSAPEPAKTEPVPKPKAEPKVAISPSLGGLMLSGAF